MGTQVAATSCALVMLVAAYARGSQRPTAREPVAIMPLAGPEVSVATRDALGAILVVQLDQLAERLRPISIGDINAQLAAELQKDAAGCNEYSCFAEIAGALGTRSMIWGRIDRLGGNLVVTLTLYDTQAQEALARAQVSSPAADVRYEPLMERAVRELLGLEPAQPTSDPRRGPVTPREAPKGTLKAGFRDLAWGTPPDKRFRKIDRYANMDRHRRDGEEKRRVAGIDSDLIYYMFADNRLCRVHVVWASADYVARRTIFAVLEREWGPGIREGNDDYISALNWKSPDGVTSASVSWMGARGEKEYMVNLLIDDARCFEKVRNDPGL